MNRSVCFVLTVIFWFLLINFIFICSKRIERKDGLIDEKSEGEEQLKK